MKKITIFLVDDHMVVREGLKALISAQPDFQIVGEVGDGTSALQAIQDSQPDIVIMDVSMPGLNGIQVTEHLQQICPRSKVLVLSMHGEASHLRQMLAVGAAGYVLKHMAADMLLQAIRVVATGGRYLDPSLVEHMVSHYVRRPVMISKLLGAALSEREREVVLGVAQGYSNKEIATRIGISVKTVETYRARAQEKLGLTSRAALVRYALDNGWLHAS